MQYVKHPDTNKTEPTATYFEVSFIVHFIQLRTDFPFST